VAKHRHLVFDKLESVTPSKTISLETKLDIINWAESGEKQSEVSQKTGLPYSAVATIVSQSKKINNVGSKLVMLVLKK
jgi:hypothetical protein